MRFVGSGLIVFVGFFIVTYNTPVNEEVDDDGVDDDGVLKDAEDTLGDLYGTIIFTCMVFRNGDRYPLSTFPTNPHNKHLIENGLGLLTQAGKMRAFNLGRWARKRYDSLINGQPYDTNLLQIISSGYDRTISSAQLFLAGFWPPTYSVREVWNDQLLWQPISILTHPRHHDRMLLPTEFCGRYNLEMERVLRSPAVTEFNEKHEKLFARVREHAKISTSMEDHAQTINKIIDVYDCFRIQEEEDLPLPVPQWAKEIYPDVMQDLLFFRQKTMNFKILRLKAGPLLAHIIKQFTRKRDAQKAAKLFQFYAGHNTTIMMLLEMLGVFDGNLISFGASILIELRLWKPKSSYIVTIFYKNGENAAPKLLNLHFCPNPCLLDDFIKSTRELIPENWEKECKTLEPDYNTIFF